MDQNIADLLKDASSEIDIEHVHSDEGINTLQRPLDMGEDVEDIISTSDQGSVETFTNVYEQEESKGSSDNSECESSNSFNTESTTCLSHEIDNDQAVNTMMAEAQQLNDTYDDKCTAEEGNMHSDLEAGDSEKELTEEEHINTLKSEYGPQMPPPKSSKSQTFEEMSESDEEVQENYSTAENSSGCESLGNKDKRLFTMSPRDDIKEFTEEDQEQIEESLADYPSDLSNSETEEPSENATAQLFTLIDTSSSVENFTDRMEEMSTAEKFQNKDSPDLDYNSGIKIMEDNLNLALEDVDLSFQKENFAEEDVQEYLTDDRYTEEDTKNKEGAGELSDVNNPADDISDSSSDDHSSSQEDTNFILTVKQKKDHVIQHNYSTENMLKGDDDDTGYICKYSDDLDAKRPEKNDKESNTELHSSIESVQSDTTIKYQDMDLDASENVEDIKNTITEVLWSSSLLIDQGNLRFEEYDWDLTDDESLMTNLCEGEHQEYTEEALDELDIGNDDEENMRDWEQEKTRIEAFYRFYGDQAEPEVEVERNHKVTFRLAQESSSSECDADSDSTEEEPDSDLNTPDINISKPEYHSESDEDLPEKPYYPERPKMQPKEQQPANASVKQPPYRNKCLAVLKSTLAFGLLTAIGIVSFWWATENMDWIH